MPHRPLPAGTIHVDALTIRPSRLCSPEFQRFYAGTIVEGIEPEWPVPARDAPQAAWDEFDAWADRQCNAAPLAAALARYPVDIVETQLGGVHVAVATPKEGIAAHNQHRVLINLHGGSFVMNRGVMGGLLESVPVASIGRIKVVTVDYRQAPFHRHPAGSEDVEAVYACLTAQYSPAAIGIYGCSAGGVLTAQAVARFQQRELPTPGAIGIFNAAPPPPLGRTPPWAPGWGDSGIWFSGRPKNEPSTVERAMARVGEWYMEGTELRDPQANPGCHAETLAKFPPTLLLSGTRDFAMSIVVAAHARLLQLEVDASLYLMEGCQHGAHIVAVDTREAHDAQSYIARWFDERLAPQPAPAT